MDSRKVSSASAVARPVRWEERDAFPLPTPVFLAAISQENGRSCLVIQHEPAICDCIPKGPPPPGLHQEKRDQQVERGGSALLLCSCETPLGVLRPVQEFLTQEGH